MKDNETIIISDDSQEEWYDFRLTCDRCRTTFMTDEPKFCPGCGKKIIGKKQGKETVFFCDQIN